MESWSALERKSGVLNASPVLHPKLTIDGLTGDRIVGVLQPITLFWGWKVRILVMLGFDITKKC
jgi:hypothetical protein